MKNFCNFEQTNDMTQYETKDGRFYFEFEYTAKEFTNSNGVGHTWQELEIEIDDYIVDYWSDDKNDHVQVMGDEARELLDTYIDELKDEVERIEQSKR